MLGRAEWLEGSGSSSISERDGTHKGQKKGDKWRIAVGKSRRDQKRKLTEHDRFVVENRNQGEEKKRIEGATRIRRRWQKKKNKRIPKSWPLL